MRGGLRNPPGVTAKCSFLKSQLHHPIPSATRRNQQPEDPGRSQPPGPGAPHRRLPRAHAVPARDEQIQLGRPARGGAGRRRGGRAGRGGARAAEGTLRAAVPAPRVGVAARGATAAGPAGPRGTMGARCYLPSATRRDAASLGEAVFSYLGTKKGRGTLDSKRNPRALALGCPRTKGLHPHPGHLH